MVKINKRNKRLLTFLLVLAIISLFTSIITANTVGKTVSLQDFSGQRDEWSFIDYDSVSITGNLTAMKGIQQNGKLYLYITGTGLNSNGVFYIDSDNNGKTGIRLPIWSNSTGIDYKIADDTLYEYRNDKWINTGTVMVNNSDTMIELELDLNDIGLLDSPKFRVGFFKDGVNSLPEMGELMVNVMAAESDRSSSGEDTYDIIVDGDISDWTGMKPLTVTADESTSIYAYVDNNNLSVLITGKIDSNEFEDGLWEHILLDTDKEPGTGCGSWAWPDTLGSDYLIQTGLVYESSADGGWAWHDTGTPFAYERAGSGVNKVIEWTLPLSAIGASDAQSINMVFLSNTLQAPDLSGDPITLVLKSSAENIVIDGDDSDWANIEVGAVSSRKTAELYAVQDDNRLYTLVKGTNLNLQNIYYIDSDNNSETGYKSDLWINSGIDYKIENGILYSYNSQYRSWIEVGPVYLKAATTAVEMNLYLEMLNRDSAGEMKLAYVGRDMLHLPAAGNNMMTISTSITREKLKDTYYPEEVFDVLYNPYMGFVPWAKDRNMEYGDIYSQPHRLVYAGITWRELEPTKGNFDWEGIEEKWQFDFWAEKGCKINIRIIMDTPTNDPTHKDIPDWLYTALMAEDYAGNPGTWYDTVEIGSGFSPNYNSPLLIAEHQRMIKALAERYNDDPRISFIQLGSLGHWAEWHTWPSGSGVFPNIDVSDRYVQHYLDNFTNKISGMRKPFPIASKQHLGLFNDMFGIKSSTNEWLEWIKNGWNQIDQFSDGSIDNGQLQAASAMPDFWKYAYSGGEFANGDAPSFLTESTIMETLRQARESHTSWLGPCTPLGNDYDREIQPNIDALLKTMGYRLVLEAVTHSNSVLAGKSLNVTMVWNNKGVAPFYYNWPLELSLLDSKGEVVFTTLTGEDIRKWLPGRTTLTEVFNIPSGISAGTYNLGVAIIDPDTGEPGIDLAIAGKREDGRYLLGQVMIESLE